MPRLVRASHGAEKGPGRLNACPTGLPARQIEDSLFRHLLSHLNPDIAEADFSGALDLQGQQTALAELGGVVV